MPATIAPLDDVTAELLAESIPQIVWTARPDGGTDYFNRRWTEYTGMTADQSHGWDWQAALHAEDRQRSLERWTEAVQSGRECEIEFRLRRASDGAHRWHLHRALPIRDGMGRIVKWLGTCTDIDDRRRTETTLRGHDEFLISVSHDLRTPLTTIQGFSQLLARLLVRPEGPDRAVMVEGLAGIATATAKMRALLDELLEAGRLEGGQPLDLNCRITDLVELTRQVLRDDMTERDRARVRLNTTAVELTGWWDGGRIERVIANLLSNAIKYSPEGSEVTVTIDSELDGDRRWARLEVADGGIGIPAADLPQIFERFHRGSNVVGRIPGTGIGLAGTYHIVTQHGGTIALESVEGAGTRARVRLPVGEAGT